MQAGQLILVRTDPATQFREALAQNAALTLNLTAQAAAGAATPTDLGALDGGLASPSAALRVKTIEIISVENLAWELWFWGTDAFNTGVLLDGTLLPLGRRSFATGDGLQIAGSGAYYYFASGVDIPYADCDGTAELHLMLINRSAAGKTAGDDGAIQVLLGCEPTLGY